MTRNEIVEQVNNLLVEEFDVENTTFAPGDNIKDTLNLDSLSLVDLIALVQQNYKVVIPVTELHNIQTFDNLYDYIETHLPKE